MFRGKTRRGIGERAPTVWERVRETFPAGGGTRNAPSRGVPKCEFDWAKPQKLFIRDLLFMAQAFDKCAVTRKNNERQG